MRKKNQKQKYILLATLAFLLLLLLTPWVVKWMKRYNPCTDPAVLNGITPIVPACLIKKDHQIIQEITALRQEVQLQLQAVESKEREIRNAGE